MQIAQTNQTQNQNTKRKITAEGRSRSEAAQNPQVFRALLEKRASH